MVTQLSGFPKTQWYLLFRRKWTLLFTILFFNVSLPVLTSAQKKLWDKTFGDNTKNQLAAMAASPDGGYILGGDGYSIKKIDVNGQKVWSKSWSGDGYDNLTTLIATSDGGICW